MPANLKARVKRLYKFLEADHKRTPDVVLLRNATDPHLDLSFFWLTGIEAGLFEGCAVAAYPDGHVTLFTTALEEQSARRSAGGFEVVVFREKTELAKNLTTVLGKSGPRTVAVNANELTYASFLGLKKLFPKAKFLDGSRAFVRARLVKDDEEVQRIAEASRIASKAFDILPDVLRVGATEAKVAAALNNRMQELGATGPSFDTIVAFGENAAEPHYLPQARKLRRGDYVLCDYGARYKRYASDITRTVVFGKASPKHRRVYELVMEASDMGIRMMNPGTMSGDPHVAVSKFIDSTEFKGRFIHSLGHSLGLAVHDGGALNPNTSVKMEPGMVFTVEPGIYLPGFGGVRIEDDVLVTKGKPKVLTTAPRDLIEL